MKILMALETTVICNCSYMNQNISIPGDNNNIKGKSRLGVAATTI
jgi:hypothetical protein